MIILGVYSYFMIFTNHPYAPLCILVGKCPTIGRLSTNCISEMIADVGLD
jgi:hypothetical protein